MLIICGKLIHCDTSYTTGDASYFLGQIPRFFLKVILNFLAHSMRLLYQIIFDVLILFVTEINNIRIR